MTPNKIEKIYKKGINHNKLRVIKGGGGLTFHIPNIFTRITCYNWPGTISRMPLYLFPHQHMGHCIMGKCDLKFLYRVVNIYFRRITRMDEMEYNCQSISSDLLSALNTQRQECKLCDVTLVVGNDVISAHRCVLAASSEYFRALFLGECGNSSLSVCHMGACEYRALGHVVDYIYSGSISITLQNVDGILQAADYLCLPEVKSFCSDLLRRNIDVTNCIHIKALVDLFSLDDIRNDVMDFLMPRMDTILRGHEVLDIPFEYIYPLLCDSQLNYIRESDILGFIFRWINHSPVERIQYVAQFIAIVNFSYLGSDYITRNIVSSKDISKVLLPEQRNAVHTKLAQHAFPMRMEDIIICRSRSVKPQQGEVKLCAYIISEDRWYIVNCPEPHMLDGLESMACDHGSLYLILVIHDDLCGYVHNSKQSKQLWKVSLDRGRWTQMPAPDNLTGQSRLVPHVRGLYVIGRTGVIDKFDNMTNSWVHYSGIGFTDSPNATMYILPMPMDRYIYTLRGFSEGYASEYSQMSFSLHRYDTDKYTWTMLTHIEGSELDLGDNERFHDYTATMFSLTLRDALGFPRVKYDLMGDQYTTMTPEVPTPVFISEIWGSASHMDKVYFTGKMSNEDPVFMFYDHDKRRFKMVSPPPIHISDLLCHVVVPRSFREVLKNAVGD